MDPDQTPAFRLIRSLEMCAVLSKGEMRAVEGLPAATRWVSRHSDISQESTRSSDCTLILQGFACRYRQLACGRRQIFSFHIPGDIPDLEQLHRSVTSSHLRALAKTKVALFPSASIAAVIRRYPNLGAALWRMSLIDAAIGREWLAGASRRNAYQRVAHLICEMFTRMSNADLVDGGHFVLPVIQVEIGDSLGLSAVHVNRVLQELRLEGLIAYAGKQLEIRDWKALNRVADFNDDYLQNRFVLD